MKRISRWGRWFRLPAGIATTAGETACPTCVLLALLSSVLLAQAPKKEEAVGLVLLPAGAKLVRAGVETPLAAKPGDILFSGDAMKTEAAPATFLYCPTKSSQALGPGGDVLFGPTQLKVRSGKVVDPKPLASCFLPQVVRVAVASQQHYGVSMTRGLKDAQEPMRCPSSVRGLLRRRGSGAHEPPGSRHLSRSRSAATAGGCSQS